MGALKTKRIYGVAIEPADDVEYYEDHDDAVQYGIDESIRRCPEAYADGQRPIEGECFYVKEIDYILRDQ